MAKTPKKDTVDASAEGQAKLDAALAEVNKKYGTGSVMFLRDTKSVAVPADSTGFPSLDLALGAGGLAKGRIVEIYGPESSGKTTLAMQILAHVQRLHPDMPCAYIDAEHAVDVERAKALGVQWEDLIFSQPDYGEQALETTLSLARTGMVPLIVVDSVAALTPKAELEGQVGQSHVGLMARMMSQGLRMLIGPASKAGCTVIFINQIREKIGVMFGSPETTPGGRALRFYASVRIDIRRKDQIKLGSEVIGNDVRVKMVKNKTGQPYAEDILKLYYKTGISREVSCVEAAVQLGVVTKDGSNQYKFHGETLAKGADAVRLHLEDNPEVMDAIGAEVAAVIADMRDELPTEDQGAPVGALGLGAAPDYSDQATGPDAAFMVRDFLLSNSGQSYELEQLIDALGLPEDVILAALKKLENAGAVDSPRDGLWSSVMITD